MSTLTVFVAGVPAPQGSKRYLGNGVLVESSKRVAPWRADIRQAAEKAITGGAHADLWNGPVSVVLSFAMPRPKHHYRTGRHADELRDHAPLVHTNTPDMDKLERAVLDAFTGIVWEDDKRVVEKHTTKTYANYEQHPGVVITVQAVTP